MIQVSFGQWRYREAGNNFDGIIKIASVRGSGSKQYYRYPSLIINNFINETSGINFYISDAGFYQSGTGVGIEFYFDNQTKIYECNDLSISGDGKSIFMQSFNEAGKRFNEITKIEMIGLFKKFSKVTFRISDRFGKTNITYTLKGSGSAINQAIPGINAMLLSIDKANRVQLDYQKNKIKLRDSLVDALRKDRFVEASLKSVKNQLNKYLNLDGYSSPYSKKYKRIIGLILFPKGVKENFQGQFDIMVRFEDLSTELITGNQMVSPDSPWFDEYDEKKAQQNKAYYGYIDNLDEKFQKFKIPKLIEAVYKKANSKSITSYPEWSIDEIDSIKATISRPFGKKIMDIKVKYYVNKPDMWPEIKSTISIRNLNITVDQLKKVGLEPLIEF